MSRIAVIGDIGGHSEELYACLVGLGVDPETLAFPDDLIVVQVGDLVHRGPDSHGVLEIVKKHIGTPRWVQLVGNHECNELEEPIFQFEEVDEEDRLLLRTWREIGLLKVATVIQDDSHGTILVTHAGLTSGYWRLLGRPGAINVAGRLNRMLLSKAEDFAKLNMSGVMLGGGSPNYKAGPIWAHDGEEVVPSWLGEQDVPFHQVHGHTNMYHWGKGTFQASRSVVDVTNLDYDKRHTASRVGNKLIWGIDASLGKYAGVKWGPLVFNGTITG